MMGQRGRPRHPDILTPREWEVLALIRRGLSNREIAGRLGIGFHRAKYPVAEVLSKVGAGDRQEAAMLLTQGEGAVVQAAAGWRRSGGLCDNRGVDARPIGMFDSGVGGLTIWRATRKVAPHQSLVFLA